MAEEERFHKAGYDSRLHFSKFLVDLRERILLSISNPKQWMFELRNYYSHICGFVEPKKLKEWIKEFKEVVSKFNISEQNRNNNYNPQEDLFELQDNIFEMSSGLFLPKQDEDEDDEDW